MRYLSLAKLQSIVRHLPYRDLEPRQGKPTQTNGDQYGLLGAITPLLGTVGAYSALLECTGFWQSSPKDESWGD